MKKINNNSGLAINRSLNTERLMKEIRHFQKIPRESEKDLIIKARQGDIKSRDILVNAHLKFVISCAQQYQNPKIDFLDLVSAGAEGLIEAVYLFDLEREIKFISYAVFSIKNKIISTITESVNMIHIPINQQEYISKFKEKKRIIEQVEGRSVTAEEVDTLLSIDKGSVNKYAAFVLSAKASTVSMDVSVSEDEPDVALNQLLSGDVNERVVSEEDNQHTKKLVNGLLTKLPPIQREILKRSFGIGLEFEQQVEDIAADLKLTPQRVKQLKSKALESLSAFKNKLV